MTEMLTNSKRTRLPWKGCLLLGIGFLTLPLTLWILWGFHAQSVLEGKLRALRERGMPISWEEVVPPLADPAWNAAPYFEDAIALIHDVKGDTLVDGPGDPKGAEYTENLRRIEHILDENAGVLDEMRKGTHLPRCRFERNYDRFPNWSLPPIRQYRDLAALAVGEARRALQRGDQSAALDRLQLAYEVGWSLREEKQILSQMTRAAAEGSARNGLEWRLPSLSPSRQELAPWLDRLQEMARDWQQVRREFPKWELVWGVSVMEVVRRGEGGKVRSALPQAWPWSAYEYLGPLRQPLVADDLSHFVDIMESMAEAAALPYDQAMQRAEALEQAVTDLPSHCLWPRWTIPSLIRTSTAAWEAETNLQMARIGLTLRAHFAEHGSYPERLEQLGRPDLPLDPFSGKPFFYRRTEEGFRLWSVGRDQVDNGGVRRVGGDDEDLLLECPRPFKTPRKKRGPGAKRKKK